MSHYSKNKQDLGYESTLIRSNDYIALHWSMYYNPTGKEVLVPDRSHFMTSSAPSMAANWLVWSCYVNDAYVQPISPSQHGNSNNSRNSFWNTDAIWLLYHVKTNGSNMKSSIKEDIYTTISIFWKNLFASSISIIKTIHVWPVS